MDKKVVGGIGVVAVLIIIAVIFFAGSGEKLDTSEQTPNSQSTDSENTVIISDEKQKYIEFEAEMTCGLLNAADAGDIATTMGKTPEIMAKYGYEDADYKRLRTKYETEDKNIQQLILSQMEKTCPEVTSQFNK
jgi:hypothetical protein